MPATSRVRLRLGIAAAMVAATAAAGERQRATVLLSELPKARESQEAWGYADIVVAGDTMYLSGVVVGQREGESLEQAYVRAFERIGATLRRVGASWDDVVEMTTFHTDLQSQMPVIVAVKSRFVAPPALAWTAVEVSRLIPDRGITEIKVVARMPAAPPK